MIDSPLDKGTAISHQQETIERLYGSLRAGNADAMAECYEVDAAFEDIAFRLRGRERIHEMWRFVTDPAAKLTVEFAIIPVVPALADGRIYAWLIDRYAFTGFPGTKSRPVVNVIVSSFTFTDNYLIKSHRDSCDPVVWARQAMDGLSAWLAGRFRVVRAVAAHLLLWRFLRKADKNR